MHGHLQKAWACENNANSQPTTNRLNQNFQVISGFICELKLLSSNTNYRNANLLTKTQKKFQIHGQKVLKNATRGYPMRKMAERKCGVITWNSKDATLKPNAIF